MSGTVGSVSPFDANSQTWEEYCEILTQFFTANDIDAADKKRAILLSGVRAQTYSLIRNLLSPEKPGDKSFEDLVKLLQNHYNPKPSEIVERFKFNSRNRKTDETVGDYVAELRKLAKDCNYGDALSQMLRDRLVCGINENAIQRRLLSESQLTFISALNIAQAMESANKNVKDLQSQFKDTTDTGVSVQQEQAQSTVNKVFTSRRQYKMPARSNCYRCGGLHNSNECRFKLETCYNCGIKGHISRACRNKAGGSQDTSPSGKGKRQFTSNDTRSALHIAEGGDTGTNKETEEMYTIYSIVNMDIPKVDPFTIKLDVNGKHVEFEVDTGCSVTIMSQAAYSKLWNNKQAPALGKCTIKLKTYTGQLVDTLGAAVVTVTYKEKVNKLPLVVVATSGPNLLGRGWLSKLEMDWRVLHQMTQTSCQRLCDVLEVHGTVFKEELGTLQGAKAKIYVDDNTNPRFFKPRSVPYAMKPKVEAELERLLKEKIIEPVQFSNWAAPIVPVLKPDGSVRICGDYKLTVNRVSKLEQYPIPKIEDLFAILAGGERFTKLDMSHAYQQVVLDEGSKEYVTINTHKGLFRYNRLPFGVSSAPAIFQRTMEGLLQGIPNVAIYLDDILVTGSTEKEHLQSLTTVLSRLEAAGLRLKRSKCTFLEKEVVFLGHKIDATGLHPVQDKVRAIQQAPAPKNVTELKAYLGLLNYYNKFLPRVSTLLTALYVLLRKDVKWMWGAKQQEAFEASKKLLQSSDVLVHYDAAKELILSCDASPYGVGAVLSHRMPEGVEKPIGFVSRTLTAAEKNYSQLDKEGLGVIFGVQKFHNYIYGRHFTICTDHKPLITLLNEMKAVPQMASPRIQRWAVTLRAYEYTIQYKPGKDHGNADAFSRLPLPESPPAGMTEDRVLLMDHLDMPPVTASQIRAWIGKDPVLARVREYVLRGWPAQVHETEMRPFFSRKDELSVLDGCILWAARVVIPKPGRVQILNQLHQAHPGSTRMKGLARSYVWWPKIDEDIEMQIKTCETCQIHQKAPAQAPLHPWEWPDKPWRRLHIDYAGPFLGKMFLVIIDAHSKWIDVYPSNTSTASVTIEKLRHSFSTHGLPETIVSDNGTAFLSSEFQGFMKANGISHVTTAPYHPASNGLAERAVQTVKEYLKKTPGNTVEVKLARALFSYRITPQSTTGLSLAEMLMGRKLRSTLDLLQPDLKRKMQKRQLRVKERHDKHAKLRTFERGDLVYVRNFGPGERWISAIVQDSTGPVSYTAKLGNGQIMRRHVDQVREREKKHTPEESPAVIPIDQEITTESGSTTLQGERLGTSEMGSPERAEQQTAPEDPHRDGQSRNPGETSVNSSMQQEVPRHSVRTRIPPNYLKDYVN